MNDTLPKPRKTISKVECDESEIWKDVVGYEGLYEVSSAGKVRSLGWRLRGKNNCIRVREGRILKQFISNKGYYMVHLRKPGANKIWLVHRIVALAFVPNPESKPHVNHLDSNRLNASCDNLEWCTRSENMVHGHKFGYASGGKGLIGRLNHHSSTPIIQKSSSGKVIAIFPSLSEVTRQLGFVQSNISFCAKGRRKLAYGFIWEYQTKNNG